MTNQVSRTQFSTVPVINHLSVNMLGMGVNDAEGDAQLAALLSELGEDPGAMTAVPENQVVVAGNDSEINLSDLEHVINTVETNELIAKMSDEAPAPAVVVVETPVVEKDGTINLDALLVTGSEPVVATVAPEKKKGGRGKKAEAKTAVEDAPKPTPEKKEAEKREYFGKDKVRRIESKLGDQLGDYTVLTMTDAVLEGAALKAAQDATMTMIGALGEKVKNRATLMIEFVAGKQSKCNGITQTALTLLKTEGKLTTGDEGNMRKALLAHPYAMNSARSMGDNTLRMLKSLKLVVDGAKGELLANPESLLLGKANSLLGL